MMRIRLATNVSKKFPTNAKSVFAAIAILSVVSVQFFLAPIIGNRTFVLLYPVVFLCAMIGGFVPGLVATGIALVSAWYLFLPQIHSAKFPNFPDIFGLFIFGLTGVLLSFYSRKLRRAESCLNQSLAKLEESILAVESANLAKSQFIANMSHEIRTPLGIILGFAELAKDPQTPASEAREYLALITRNAEQLTQIIGDVLDLSKLEADKMEIDRVRFPLQTFLEEIVASMQATAKSKSIAVSLEVAKDLPGTVRTDPTRLRQILTNIIGNAIKFTSSGYVKISVRAFPATAIGMPINLEFNVEDSGIGITATQKDKLFKRFSQADGSASRNFGGTGLGLVLSQQLAKALGGNLELQRSDFGVGSCFTFTINAGSYDGSRYHRDTVVPLSRASSLDKSKYEKLIGKNILVVDDSLDNQALVGRLLKHIGMNVEFASDGSIALEKINNLPFDIVLMDIQMPVMDGRESTLKLRAGGFKKPIIALTAHALEAEQKQAMKEGFSSYLTKPIKRDLLFEEMNRFV
jgi:signal transduction histidine kinase